jgi:hypothetical protein
MATAKTETLSFRMAPDLKKALRVAAEREHRSIANMVEVMILDYCARTGIAIDRHRRAAQARRAARVNG